MKCAVYSLFSAQSRNLSGSNMAIQFQDLIPKLFRMNLDKHKHCRAHLSWFIICLVNSDSSITLSHTSQQRIWRKTATMQGHTHSMERDDPDTCHTAQGTAKQGRTNRATSADQGERPSPAEIITDSRSKVQCYQCSRVQERRPILG